MTNGQRPIDEISRQLDLIHGERWSRILLSMLAIGMTAIYLPFWVVSLCVLGNVTFDVLGMRYMRALSPKRHPRRYRLVLVMVFLREFFYAAAAVLVWLHPENYGQSYSVGMIMAQLLQLAMLRAIHLPFGYAGMVAIASLVLTSNTYFWVYQDMRPHGLFFSTIAVIAAVVYTLTAMRSNNRLHKNFAADRAAAMAGDKAKSRFLAQMSHELRTPLNAILGMGHAELRRNKDALSQNRLTVLIASAEGLSTILDDILDMSAIEAGRLPIRAHLASPAQEITATLGLFQPTIAESGLLLTKDIGPQLDGKWVFDPQRMRQCMSNLLSNALKNTSHGGIHVAAQLMGSATNAPMLRIEVTDTGPGIPSHLHRTLFEPFSQARKPKAGAESNGLGLSICRTMAQQMGGDLTIAPNREGESGAQFVLTLTLAHPPVDLARAAGDTGLAPMLAPAQAGISGLKVLVIDDIATNRLVASTYLRMLGATMLEAESGAKGLEILAADCPDLVLLDMNMPEMNGLQTLANIRALPCKANKIPVIAMTADAMAEHRDFYLSSGLDGYLAKPINPERIESEIKAVLDKASKPRPD